MSDKISLNELFKSGLNKDQFKAGMVSGKDNSNLSEIYSLFGDNIEGAADNIFAALDTNKNGMLDEVEVQALKKKFDDKTQDDVTENDVKSFAMENVMKKYGTTKPSQMYKNAMSSAGDPRTSDYIPSLENQIQTLENLITQRQFTAKTRTESYQDEIDNIVKDCAKKKGIDTSKYSQYSSDLKSLKEQVDKNTSDIALKQRELEQAKKDKQSLDKELEQLQKDPEKNKTEIEGVKFDISSKATEISTLTNDISSIQKENSALTEKMQTASKSMESIQNKILENDSTSKDKVIELKSKISAEAKDSAKDINNYKKEINVLNNAKNYAMNELIKQQEQASSNPADVDYSNTGKNCPDLKGVNYSAAKGQKLANYMRNHAIGFTGHCSRYVANGLAATGLGHERTASAHMMDTPLSKNSNYKEINVSSQDELKNLPAGCIIVYEAGAAGYNKTHGHIEVSLGNGTNASDGITRNPRYVAGNRMHVFVPVA